MAKTHTSGLGIDWIEGFGLWDKRPTEFCMQITDAVDSNEEFIKKLQVDFKDVFSESLGCCTITTAKLHLKDPSVVIYRPKREVPYAIREVVEEELNRLERLNIITPVTYSKFAAPIVIVRKANGTIRICADYSSGLNNALLPHDYPIPTPESIFASVSTCKVFSKIDLSDAYLQIPVNDEAKAMLAITTHRGVNTMNRLCPGVKPASGIFQQTMDRMLEGTTIKKQEDGGRLQQENRGSSAQL